MAALLAVVAVPVAVPLTACQRRELRLMDSDRASESNLNLNVQHWHAVNGKQPPSEPAVLF